MEKWKLPKCASGVIGGKGLWLGEKMECYQKEKRIEKLYQKSESPQLPEWINTLDFYISYFKKQQAEAEK